MTLLSTQYKTPRHPSYRSNPFTTIPHPTGNPLRAKKTLPVSRVHALFQICSTLLSVYIWVIHFDVGPWYRDFFYFFFFFFLVSDENLTIAFRHTFRWKWKLPFSDIHHDFENERSTKVEWKFCNRKFAFLDQKKKKKENREGWTFEGKKNEKRFSRGKRRARLTSIIDGKKKEKKKTDRT